VTDRNRQAYLDIALLILDQAAQELARTGRPAVLERAALALAAIGKGSGGLGGRSRGAKSCKG
jgi:hypothetical protein